MSAERSLKVATWNLEWASARSQRGKVFDSVLATAGADILCLTEAHATNFSDAYHVIAADPDYGYEQKPGRRKVFLGSRNPWCDVDELGSNSLPSGRYIAGTTDTTLGPVRVVGVCIPWRDAHVRTGRKDRKPWEDHEAYIAGLKRILSDRKEDRAMVLGDFNQALPRRHQPAELEAQLEDCLSGFTVLTRGTSSVGRSAIDHIAVSKSLQGEVDQIFSREQKGLRLSDHFGLSANVRSAR